MKVPRDQVSLQHIRRYIVDNPLRWDSDEYHPASKGIS